MGRLCSIEWKILANIDLNVFAEHFIVYVWNCFDKHFVYVKLPPNGKRTPDTCTACQDLII